MATISDELLTRLLRPVIAGLAVPLTEAQINQLVCYFSLLLRWSDKINLTSVRTPAEMAWRHFGESLFLAKLTGPPAGLIVDVGSGAGFPGMVLKIAWPDVQTVLLEPSGKKVTFLKEVTRQCGISGIEVQSRRLEDALPDLASRVSLATVRAVRVSGDLLADLKLVLAPDGAVALFAGKPDALEISKRSGFAWQALALIPHSQRRVVLIGKNA